MSTTPPDPSQSPMPGHFHASPSQPAATPARAAAPAPSRPVPPKPAAPPTHVLVPVATLQAMHDTLSAHAETLRGLIPSLDPKASAENLAAATEARLRAQGVGK